MPETARGWLTQPSSRFAFFEFPAYVYSSVPLARFTRQRNDCKADFCCGANLTHDTDNYLQLTWPQVALLKVEVGETDQILTVSVESTPMCHTTNGVLTAVAKCQVDNSCQ